MKPQEIELLANRDEATLRSVFGANFGPVYTLVTENHGSVDEARGVYSEAFIIFLQLTDREGSFLKAPAGTIVYSVARKLWLKTLTARKVDTTTIVHRYEYIELEGVFDLVDALNNSEELLDQHINALGEPCRTLVTEVVGRSKDLDEVSARVGFTDKSRAESQLIVCLAKVLKNIQGVEEAHLDADQVKKAWQQMLGILPEEELAQYEMMINENIALAEFEGSLLALRDQIKAFVSRRDLKLRMGQYQKELLPDISSPVEINGKHDTMKTSKTLILAIVLAIVISIATAWIVVSLFFTDRKVERIEIIREQLEKPESKPSPPEAERVVPVVADTSAVTALAISRDGYFISAGSNLENTSALRVVNSKSGTNYKVVLVSTFPELGDVALLKVEDETFTTLPVLPFRFASENAALGQEVFCLSINGEFITYHQSYLSKVPLSGNGEFQNYFSRFSEYISNGSPVVSASGNFIGTAVGNENGVCRIVKSNILLEKLDSLRQSDKFEGDLPRYNYLYSKPRTEQVEKLEDFVYQVKLFY